MIPTFSPQGDGNWRSCSCLSRHRSLDLLIPTFSPQGDGNSWMDTPWPLGVGTLIPTFSPQGDGNVVDAIVVVADHHKSLIPTFSPQGDGNHSFLSLPRPVEDEALVDPYLFPARGRKRYAREGCKWGGTSRVDPYLFPARGRKRHSVFSLSYPIERLIPTFSPQGDGNTVSNSILLSVFGNVDPYLFPARGRKHSVGVDLGLKTLALIPTFSPQGDGNCATGRVVI